MKRGTEVSSPVNMLSRACIHSVLIFSPPSSLSLSSTFHVTAKTLIPARPDASSSHLALAGLSAAVDKVGVRLSHIPVSFSPAVYFYLALSSPELSLFSFYLYFALLFSFQ
ncbi:hypothetical protein E2C01_079055 [Portunus trituberculatus]|uniref:Uncharacterized protein n=1 Tax=Portunus trituberculatus TaxID=210409 RepID=A0A5B7IUJ2_PORTR|nr:hypothetical protein [Portunus trituberculatus]